MSSSVSQGYLLNAGVCALCYYEPEKMKDFLHRAEGVDATFPGRREYQFISDLTAAYEQGDAEKFTVAVQEYDSMTKLDTWKTTLLLKAKKRVAASELEGEDLT
jgi:alpha-soluble NSF attachment protein